MKGGFGVEHMEGGKNGQSIGGKREGKRDEE